MSIFIGILHFFLAIGIFTLGVTFFLMFIHYKQDQNNDK